MGKPISVTAADGHTFNAYTAGSETATQGVVVLQEIFGVNEHICDMADKFGAAGYYAIATPLFDRAEKDVELGYGPDDRKKGMELRGKIKEEDAIADIVASAKALGVKSVAVVGYCWGGSLAWAAATHTNAFDAASCWYGGGIPAAKDEKPNCPVEMHFGETDGSIPMIAVEEVKKAQPQAEIYTYSGAGHGFGCDDRDSFNQEAYDLAQKRTLDFFKKHLK